jgi:hypothetical protein
VLVLCFDREVGGKEGGGDGGAYIRGGSSRLGSCRA